MVVVAKALAEDGFSAQAGPLKGWTEFLYPARVRNADVERYAGTIISPVMADQQLNAG